MMYIVRPLLVITFPVLEEYLFETEKKSYKNILMVQTVRKVLLCRILFDNLKTKLFVEREEIRTARYDVHLQNALPR